MIYDRIDVLLIQKFLSNEAVAIYSVAYSLYRNSSILSGIFLIKVYNDVSKYFITKGKIDFKTFWQTFRILILISLGLILFYNLIGEFLVKLFFTSKFIYSVKILGAVSFALPFIFLNNLTGVTLNSIHREKVTMFSTFIGMLVNVATNLLIIPKIGILGAVISTIITEWIILVCQLLAIIFINRKLNNV
jgi:O-antigen/teichoic acid export membrane protein